MLEVGTGNSSVDNLAFYQRCGYRIARIVPDHFAYVQPPVTEFGIPLRDLVVLRYAAGAGSRLPVASDEVLGATRLIDNVPLVLGRLEET